MRDVRITSPTDPKTSRHGDGADRCGRPAVGENDRLVGMITDRDIAIRGIGEGKGPMSRSAK